MKLPRIGVKYAHITVTSTLFDGSTASLSGVDVAVVAHRSSPDLSTVWHTSAYNAPMAVVLLAGPDVTSPPGGAILVPEPGMDLWARVTDTPEVDAAFIDHIDLI